MAINYDKYFHLISERGITTGQILKDAGISANILTRMKRNEYISLESIEKICNALQCDTTDIFSFTNESNWEE